MSEKQARDMLLKVQSLIEMDNVAMGGIECIVSAMTKFAHGLPVGLVKEVDAILSDILAKREQLRKDAFPRELMEEEG